MEVILIEEVPNLGQIGDLKKVAPGYGRNFLLPKKLAIMASTDNKRRLEHQKRIAGFRRAKARGESEAAARRLSSMTVRIARKVGDQNKLYGSVTAHDVQRALEEQGVVIDRRKFELSDPIKALGDYTVPVRFDGDIRAEVKLSVVAE